MFSVAGTGRFPTGRGGGQGRARPTGSPGVLIGGLNAMRVEVWGFYGRVRAVHGRREAFHDEV